MWFRTDPLYIFCSTYGSSPWMAKYQCQNWVLVRRLLTNGQRDLATTWRLNTKHSNDENTVNKPCVPIWITWPVSERHLVFDVAAQSQFLTSPAKCNAVCWLVNVSAQNDIGGGELFLMLFVQFYIFFFIFVLFFVCFHLYVHFLNIGL